MVPGPFLSLPGRDFQAPVSASVPVLDSVFGSVSLSLPVSASVSLSGSCSVPVLVSVTVSVPVPDTFPVTVMFLSLSQSR